MRRVRAACLLVWCCLWAAAVRPLGAQEVVAVISSDLAPYREAYQGFETALALPVTQVNLQTGRPRIGRGTRVVVAFGGKAAMEEYPRDLTVIYCMAPGTTLNADQRQGPTIRINMLPVAGKVVDALSDLQPSLRHLAVLWVTDTMTDYVTGLQRVGGEAGLEVAAERLQDPDQLPDTLRRLIGRRVEALWVPPRPPADQCRQLCGASGILPRQQDPPLCPHCRLCRGGRGGGSRGELRAKRPYRR